MTIIATTSPGMEDVAVAEGTRLLAEAGFAVTKAVEHPQSYPVGTVLWELETGISPLEWLNESPFGPARSVYHVYAAPTVITWDGRTLDSLVSGTAAYAPRWLAAAGSFRVTCERAGTHAFRSPDVERAVGTSLHERYRTPGRMEGYAVHIGIEIHDEIAFVGYRLTRKKGLDRRYEWHYHPRITLRTPVAYLMLARAGFADHPGSLYDPCCGSGTILLEAGSVAAAAGAAVSLSGSDREPAAVDGARANLAANGIEATVEQIDLNTLRPRLAPASVDFVVTNPPYGVRLGKRIDYHLLYQSLLSVAVHALRDGGRLAVLVERREGAFGDVQGSFPKLREIERRPITIGRLHPRLIVLERTRRET